MSGAEFLIRQGEAVGETRGRRELLLVQIEEKFGAVPESVSDRLAELNSTQLDRVARRIVNAKSFDDLGLQG